MQQRQALDYIPSLVSRTLAFAREQGITEITRVGLALGEIAELDLQAIRSRWREVSKGTLVESAKLQFHMIEAEVQCMACFRTYHPVGGEIHCPHCGSHGAKILRGEEFYVESVE